VYSLFISFFSQAEDGIRDFHVTGVQTCTLPIFPVLFRLLPVEARRGEGPSPEGGRGFGGRSAPGQRIPVHAGRSHRTPGGHPPAHRTLVDGGPRLRRLSLERRGRAYGLCPLLRGARHLLRAHRVGRDRKSVV